MYQLSKVLLSVTVWADAETAKAAAAHKVKNFFMFLIFKINYKYSFYNLSTFLKCKVKHFSDNSQTFLNKFIAQANFLRKIVQEYPPYTYIY